MVMTLWKFYQHEDEMFFCISAAKFSFARIYYAWPLYLGDATQKMGEDSVLVGYGMELYD